ncbi:MAG: TraR/DksA C4-type zinc finger protein [Chloroflexi bacterium]|nr:TraR/DksA C4-type zinc finger protein [Chloroflexota bacterium]
MSTKFSHLRSRLEDEKKHLLSDLAQLQDSGRPDEVRREGSPFGKREEEATESFELEKRLAVEKQTKDHLAAIEHALHKFDEGTYGLCDNCGKAIDPARLEVLPHATLCMVCKEKNARGRSFTG